MLLSCVYRTEKGANAVFRTLAGRRAVELLFKSLIISKRWRNTVAGRNQGHASWPQAGTLGLQLKIRLQVAHWPEKSC
jgi:hypothetical protein